MNNLDRSNPTRLVVYGNDYCTQAVVLQRALDEHHIDYEWRDVTDGDPRFQDELRQLAHGNLSVPTVLFPDGTVMVEPWSKDVLNRLRPKRPGLLKRWFSR